MMSKREGNICHVNYIHKYFNSKVIFAHCLVLYLCSKLYMQMNVFITKCLPKKKKRKKNQILSEELSKEIAEMKSMKKSDHYIPFIMNLCLIE